MFPNWINFVFDKQHLSAKKSKGRSQSLISKSVQVCGEFLVDIVTVELVGSHWVQHVTYYMKATSFWALRRALFTRIYRTGVRTVRTVRTSEQRTRLFAVRWTLLYTFN